MFIFIGRWRLLQAKIHTIFEQKKIGPLPTWPGTPLHVDFSAMRTVHNVVFHRTLVAQMRCLAVVFELIVATVDGSAVFICRVPDRKIILF